MGCFLACFGISKKRKRRRPSKRVISTEDQSHGSYEPLDSHSPINVGLIDNSACSNSSISNKQPIPKTKKKVRFNLNVQAYEPLPDADSTPCASENDEEEEEKRDDIKDRPEISLLPTLHRENSIPSKVASKLSYRYENCSDSYDEDNLLEYGDSDFEADDEEEDDDDLDSDLEFDDDSVFCNPRVEEKAPSSQTVQNAGNMDHHAHSVLIPVENLAQWKILKAKPETFKKQYKENIALEQESQAPFKATDLKTSFSLSNTKLESTVNCSRLVMQDIAVNSSLSSWLALPKPAFDAARTASIS